MCVFFFFQAEDGIRDRLVTGVQTCALPIYSSPIYPVAPAIAILIGSFIFQIVSANNIKRYSNRELSFRKLKAFSRFFMTVFFTLNSSRVSCGKFFFF